MRKQAATPSISDSYKLLLSYKIKVWKFRYVGLPNFFVFTIIYKDNEKIHLIGIVGCKPHSSALGSG